MDHPFEVGGTYRNRDGDYEVLEISGGRMVIRYEDGRRLETTVRLQARIWKHVQAEEKVRSKRRKTARCQATTRNGHPCCLTKRPYSSYPLPARRREQLISSNDDRWSIPGTEKGAIQHWLRRVERSSASESVLASLGSVLREYVPVEAGFIVTLWPLRRALQERVVVVVGLWALWSGASCAAVHNAHSLPGFSFPRSRHDLISARRGQLLRLPTGTGSWGNIPHSVPLSSSASG